jgi:wyosine [tRNA(Phe)-imidazoG37] synthetase (radical SAM superfamily)
MNVALLAFGPVPSRRLGRSLGINNIPPKACSYSCVYCQVGRTGTTCVERRAFWPRDEIVASVRARAAACRAAGEAIDHLTVVPDGEPTLDLELGRVIRDLKPLGIPVAVITNATLLAREDVRADLAGADWVSLKVDAVREATWRRINRPDPALDHAALLRGMRDFARAFTGELTTETMLVDGINDGPEELGAVADLLAELAPARAYLAVPTRPPAEDWVRPADVAAIARAYAILRERALPTELLLGYEGDVFAATGDARSNILAVTAVHPMRETAVHRLLASVGADWAVVQAMIDQGQLVAVRHGAHRYFLRPVPRRGAAPQS